MSRVIIDKTFEGMLRAMRKDITELQRRPWKNPSTALPDSWQAFGPDNSTVTAAASTWENIDPALSVTFTPATPLRVNVMLTAVITGNGTVYGMIGVRASGGLVLDPEVDQATAAIKYANTPFNQINGGVTVTGFKVLTLPAGVATTLTMQRRRNSAAFAPNVNYSSMRVIPEAWA